MQNPQESSNTTDMVTMHKTKSLGFTIIIRKSVSDWTKLSTNVYRLTSNAFSVLFSPVLFSDTPHSNDNIQLYFTDTLTPNRLSKHLKKHMQMIPNLIYKLMLKSHLRNRHRS